jgi:hypothetical protein
MPVQVYSLRRDNYVSRRRKKIKAALLFKTLKGSTSSYLRDFYSIDGTGYIKRNSEIKLCPANEQLFNKAKP